MVSFEHPTNTMSLDSANIQNIKKRYGIIGNAQGLNRALDIAVQVATTDLSVLIIGESGVGKEVLPRIIHDNSSRKHNKYFAINCGSIPEGTIDAELFGHAKGAFTGAIGEREGYFGTANNGTLFLDEVGELPLPTQARLLRVLETGEYIRVGDNEIRHTNVRIVAATNVNMQKAIREGRFREDLYYRLNTVPITLPPLRERGNDIELLFRKFARDISDKYHREPVTLTDDAKELLLRHKWPGNIRQLRNLTEQISVISSERLITSNTLNEFGITDDSLGEQGLVLHGQQANRNTSDKQQGPSYDQERDMLFGLLAHINQELQDLKKLMHSNIYTPGHVTQMSAPDIQDEMQRDSSMFVSTQQQQYPFPHNPYTDQRQAYQQANPTFSQHDAGTGFVKAYDFADPVIEETSLSMRDMERTNIAKALERHHNNRKKAATELGISERTLYRKIKTYGLDE